jgi:hypothetical protein
MSHTVLSLATSARSHLKTDGAGVAAPDEAAAAAERAAAIGADVLQAAAAVFAAIGGEEEAEVAGERQRSRRLSFDARQTAARSRAVRRTRSRTTRPRLW